MSKKFFDVDVCFIGVQGAGKGTQALKLWGKFGKDEEWLLIQTGNLFREVSREDSKLGRTVKEIIESGNLVPDSITNEIIFKKLSCDFAKSKNWIFDGYPRNVFQAEKFLEFYKEQGRERLVVIFLELSPKEALERLKTRLICKDCNAIANEKFGLAEGDICKHCGGVLKRRSDEKDLEVIKRRIELFYGETLPVCDFFSNAAINIQKVDASLDIKSVHREILKILESYKVL